MGSVERTGGRRVDPSGKDRPMSAGPQLSSLSTALSELTERVSDIAESFSGTTRDDVAVALFEVERSLVAARRRLEQVVDELR